MTGARVALALACASAFQLGGFGPQRVASGPRSATVVQSVVDRAATGVGTRAGMAEVAKPKATMEDDVFVKRAKTEAALSMDYLDLLRNGWLDAVQQLESDLDAEGFDAKTAAGDLDAARRGARKWLEAARAPTPPTVGALCVTR